MTVLEIAFTVEIEAESTDDMVPGSLEHKFLNFFDKYDFYHKCHKMAIWTNMSMNLRKWCQMLECLKNSRGKVY